MLSILMPVYNERERVERAIAEVLDTPLPTEFELIVVDDGSTDGTREILRRVMAEIEPPNRVRLFEHEHNQGKGAAVQTALSATPRASSPRSSTRTSSTTRPTSGC